MGRTFAVAMKVAPFATIPFRANVRLDTFSVNYPRLVQMWFTKHWTPNPVDLSL
jgi:hypothetical protein